MVVAVPLLGLLTFVGERDSRWRVDEIEAEGTRADANLERRKDSGLQRDGLGTHSRSTGNN